MAADGSDRLEELTALVGLQPQALKQHIGALTGALEDPDDGVKTFALECLQKLDRASLRQSMGAIIKLLDADSDVLKIRVLRFIGVQDRHVVNKAAVSIVKLLKSKNDELRNVVVETICKHPSRLLNKKIEDNDTPLHLAARDGHLAICQRLVRAGALVNVKNRQRNMPIDLARLMEHTEVVDFLGTRLNPFTIVGGTGDALDTALADERPILRVEWYTIPLPRLYGTMGATHSLLAIMVGDSEECSHTYVIEKAATVRASGETESGHIKNGVHVSHWFDVAPVIGDGPIHSLDQSEIVAGVTLRKLWQIGVDLGPYEIAYCNCHHMAFEAYNACAEESAKVADIPNYYLINIAWFFSPLAYGSGPSAPSSFASVGVSYPSSASASLASVRTASLSEAPNPDLARPSADPVVVAS